MESLPQPMQPDNEVELVTDPSDQAVENVEGNTPSVPESHFEPVGLAIETGEVVRFSFTPGSHTVTSYHNDHGRQRRVPEGVPPFSSSVLSDEASWLYRFVEPGVYDLFCAKHEIYGMVMRVVVGEAEADFGERSFPERQGPTLTAGRTLDDGALAPARILDQGQIQWEDVADQSKRLLVTFEEAPENDGEDEDQSEVPNVDEIDEQVTLTYGETAHLSNGVTFTVHGVTTHETLGDEVPEDRDLFAVVDAETQNTSDEERTVPGAGEIELLFGAQQVRWTINSAAIRDGGYQQLEGGDVQPGVRREGVSLFEVDEGHREQDIDVLWQDQYWVVEEGEVDVRWTTPDSEPT